MALREQISHCLDFSLKTQPELCAENVQQVVFLSYITIHSHVELLNYYYYYYWFESVFRPNTHSPFGSINSCGSTSVFLFLYKNNKMLTLSVSNLLMSTWNSMDQHQHYALLSLQAFKIFILV